MKTSFDYFLLIGIGDCDALIGNIHYGAGNGVTFFNEISFKCPIGKCATYNKDIRRVRICETYKDEYKECKSVRARFHQYFIFGETLDCSQWKTDYENCKQFRNNRDLKSLESVIESENERYQKRKLAVEGNNVWEYRNEPPSNWNSPMPEWMVERKKGSLLIETQNLLNQGITPSKVFTGISCSIM